MPPFGMSAKTYNILMYSHDTYGLGHIRRTMAIAKSLLQDDVNILIITGSPIAGRFEFPKGIEFVRIPGMIKRSNTVYLPHAIRVAPRHAMNIRRDIITAAAQAFDPSLFIVDKVPTGLKNEILPLLQWFRHNRPATRTILGLRDILDDAHTTRKEWQRKNFIQVLRELYSEIWVYGQQKMYDPITEYAFPDDIAQKTVFTGYLPRCLPLRPARQEVPHELVRSGLKKIILTTGGGGDGAAILDTYLTMLETNPSLQLDTLMISGPFIPQKKHDSLAERARTLGVDFRTFTPNLESNMAQADLVICMGGYNTVCEVLSLKQVALIIPRDRPRREQLIRAEALARQNLAAYIKWDDMTPETLREKILALLKDSRSYRQATSDFPMTGLDSMRQRLAFFREHNT